MDCYSCASEAAFAGLPPRGPRVFGLLGVAEPVGDEQMDELSLRISALL